MSCGHWAQQVCAPTQGMDSVALTPAIFRLTSSPVNLFAAFFSFTFAGYFAPQSRGGLSPRNV